MTTSELENKYQEIYQYMETSHFKVTREMVLNWKNFLDELYSYGVENDGYTMYIKLKIFPFSEFIVFTYSISKDSIFYGRPFKTCNSQDLAIRELNHIIDARGYIDFPMNWWTFIYCLTEEPLIEDGPFLESFCYV